MKIAAVLAWVAMLLSVATTPAHADDAVAGFYQGRTINLVIGTSAGGGYDLYARVLAKHMGDHIPGRPRIVPQNMPGAGTLRAMLYLYSVAPKDGTVFATFSRTLPIAPALGLPGANFDPAKLTWLGSITKDTVTCVAGQSSAVKAWPDLFTTEFKAGGEGKGADPDVIAAILKNVFGAKVKLVTGYPGLADAALAMERGELDGMCGLSYSSIRATHPDWLRDQRVHILVQGALAKDPLMPEVPAMLDLATTAEQKAILRLVLAPQAMARPFAAPPGVPPDRAQALQAAFAATMTDPAFVAEMQKLGLDIDPMTEAEVTALLASIYATPPAVMRQAATASGY